jgi:predicted 3-demethylubiquinone-9 3-methyltransferase (glyoxalase superfamily)
VSWQVHPVPLEEMMAKGSHEQVARVTQAFLRMKKFDIEKLREAFAGGKARAGGGRR